MDLPSCVACLVDNLTRESLAADLSPHLPRIMIMIPSLTTVAYVQKELQDTIFVDFP